MDTGNPGEPTNRRSAAVVRNAVTSAPRTASRWARIAVAAAPILVLQRPSKKAPSYDLGLKEKKERERKPGSRGRVAH